MGEVERLELRCEVDRDGGWFKARLKDRCGLEGRFWAPKTTVGEDALLKTK